MANSSQRRDIKLSDLELSRLDPYGHGLVLFSEYWTKYHYIQSDSFDPEPPNLVARVFGAYGRQWELEHDFTPDQLKVMEDIERQPALGRALTEIYRASIEYSTQPHLEQGQDRQKEFSPREALSNYESNIIGALLQALGDYLYPHDPEKANAIGKMGAMFGEGVITHTEAGMAHDETIESLTNKMIADQFMGPRNSQRISPDKIYKGETLTEANNTRHELAELREQDEPSDNQDRSPFHSFERAQEQPNQKEVLGHKTYDEYRTDENSREEGEKGKPTEHGDEADSEGVPNDETKPSLIDPANLRKIKELVEETTSEADGEGVPHDGAKLSLTDPANLRKIQEMVDERTVVDDIHTNGPDAGVSDPTEHENEAAGEGVPNDGTKPSLSDDSIRNLHEMLDGTKTVDDIHATGTDGPDAGVPDPAVGVSAPDGMPQGPLTPPMSLLPPDFIAQYQTPGNANMSDLFGRSVNEALPSSMPQGALAPPMTVQPPTANVQDATPMNANLTNDLGQAVTVSPEGISQGSLAPSTASMSPSSALVSPPIATPAGANTTGLSGNPEYLEPPAMSMPQPMEPPVSMPQPMEPPVSMPQPMEPPVSMPPLPQMGEGPLLPAGTNSVLLDTPGPESGGEGE
jgi:hypothetical protein